jgi:hypothetical protein
MSQGQDAVIEGEFIAESVQEVSDPQPSQSNLTGLGSVTEELEPALD